MLHICALKECFKFMQYTNKFTLVQYNMLITQYFTKCAFVGLLHKFKISSYIMSHYVLLKQINITEMLYTTLNPCV
jgi:hypothetical protein